MGIHVREASLTEDGPILVSLTRRFLSGTAADRRFQWLYLENPFGPARAWIACDDQNEAVGMAAIFPRQMYCDGGVVPGCVLGDFCISPNYRSLGPALQLQRACLASAQSPAFAIAYDFPSATMFRIYQHLGLGPIGSSVRWVKPLRFDDKIERLLPVPLLARSLAAAANLAVAVKDRVHAGAGDIEVRLDDVAGATQYSELADRIGSSPGICTVRSAQYLQWRYQQHPERRYEFLSAYRGQELLAYCTFAIEHDGNATVAELFGSMDKQLLSTLLHRLVELLRGRALTAISLPMMKGDPRTNLLRKLGFWAREEVPVVGFGRDSLLSGGRMFLMHGDRES